MADEQRYNSPLTGAEVDRALYDMANHISERYAKGTANGVPVTSGQVGYQDNAKYYAQQAKTDADRAESAIPVGAESAVLWTMAQSLTDSAKQVARNNIGAGNPLGTVAGSTNLLDYKNVYAVTNNTSYPIEENGYKIVVSGNVSRGTLRYNITHLKGRRLYLIVDSFTKSNSSAIVFVGFNIKLANGSSVYPNIGQAGTKTYYDIPADVQHCWVDINMNDTSTTVNNTLTVYGLRVVVEDNTPFEPYYESNLMLTQKVNWDLLWTNASPTSAFAPQTISLDLSKYKYVGIIFNAYISATALSEIFIFKKNITYGGAGAIFHQYGYLQGRAIREISNTGVIFLNGYGNGTQTADDAHAIPYQIYGIR